jgi:GntR family transcriptional regulator / MocR family aminotransferase
VIGPLADDASVSKNAQLSDLPLGARGADTTLFRWLYDEVRTAIVAGRLRPGTRLPSSRTIARQRNVARGTVVAAFEQLAAEGYIECVVGSGTFVKPALPEALLQAKPLRAASRADTSPAGLSSRGRCLAEHPFPKLYANRSAQTFRLDRPALDVFPIKTWSRMAARRLRQARSELLSHGHPLGFEPLRAAIASYVGLTRGIKCSADEVVITSGTQQSLDLIARLLLDRGDCVWVEDPGYPAVSALLRAGGAAVVGVPVDAEGIQWSTGRKRDRSARMAYVTPGCQFPLGVTMSLPRRRALLDWAHRENAWIFEDDYDGAFRFSGRPLAALRSLDSGGHVIYSNTFNKVLFPSLRLAFLVVPPRLVDAVAAARSVLERFPPLLDQAILCDFIVEGHLGQHMRRMRDLYASRLDCIIRSVRTRLSGLLDMSPLRGGLQIVGWLPSGVNDVQASQLAGEYGVDSCALSRLSIERTLPGGLVLGVASAGDRAIRRGVERLGEALRQLAR